LVKKSTKEKAEYIADKLEKHFKKLKIAIEVEYKPNERIRDSIYIYLENNQVKLILEIDNLRADQVAKKLLSRIAMFKKQDIIYITFCYYSNSAKGHKTECLKYINVHFSDFISLHPNVEYLAFIPTKQIE
jgi:CCR4-NOT transcriptional regulation complex NOT5 subunit